MLRLLARSGAAVVIVGALVFAVPVSAQALDPWDVAWFELSAAAAEAGTVGAVVGEGVVAAAPEVASGFACAATIVLCAAVGGAVIGATLYLTKDTWVPWFTNGATLANAVSGCGPNVCLGLINQPFTAGSSLSFHIWGSPTGTAGARGFNFTGSQRDAAGVVTTFTGTHNGTWFWCTPTSNWPDGGVDYTPPAGNTIIQLTVAEAENNTPILTYGGPGVAPAVASLQVSCTNPDGSQYEVTSSVPSAGGMVQMPTCTGKPGDLGGAHAKCVTLLAGTQVPATTVESSNCVAAGQAGTLYPECVAAGCLYVVYVDGVPCTVGRAGCTDWARTYAASPGRVGCKYGTHWVSADHCFFLERVYENGLPVPATLGNTDGNPDTFTGPAPANAAQPQPQPQPIPNGAPGGAPGALPGGATGTLPIPAGTQTTNGDCFGGGSFSWNPVDWVVTPVKCALAWAFVPSPAYLAQWSNSVGTGFAGTSLGRWSASLGGLVPAITGTGCAGPSLSTGFMSGLPGHPIAAEIHPFNACSAPMSTVAATSYMVLSAGIAFYGGMKVVRQLGYAFGFQIHAGSERSTFT